MIKVEVFSNKFMRTITIEGPTNEYKEVIKYYNDKEPQDFLGLAMSNEDMFEVKFL